MKTNSDTEDLRNRLEELSKKENPPIEGQHVGRKLLYKVADRILHALENDNEAECFRLVRWPIGHVDKKGRKWEHTDITVMPCEHKGVYE